MQIATRIARIPWAFFLLEILWRLHAQDEQTARYDDNEGRISSEGRRTHSVGGRGLDGGSG